MGATMVPVLRRATAEEKQARFEQQVAMATSLAQVEFPSPGEKASDMDRVTTLSTIAIHTMSGGLPYNFALEALSILTPREREFALAMMRRDRAVSRVGEWLDWTAENNEWKTSHAIAHNRRMRGAA